jgi:hypothetical protein
LFNFIGYKGGNSKNSKYRNKLTLNIDHELDEDAFNSRSKDGKEGVFSRSRKLKIRDLIIMIIKFRSSIQRELDRFVREVSNADFSIREVTKGAFTQARAKLNPWAFKRLNEVACNTFYEDAPFLT